MRHLLEQVLEEHSSLAQGLVPMGLLLFVLARVAGLSFERTTMAILPWLVPLLVSLGIITYMPQLVLWLPKLFFS
jgi:TRAP-type C4-dicarboxylate transport system permease large subunit